MQIRPNFNRSIGKYLVGSLLLHFFVWSSLTLVQWLQQLSLPTPVPEVVEIQFISSLEENEVQDTQKPETRPQDSQPQQIVEQSEEALNDEIPEDSRFLSRHSQRVKQQTRAAESGAFRNTGELSSAPKPAETQEPSDSQPTELAETAEADQVPTQASPEPQPKAVSPISLADLRPQFQPRTPASVTSETNNRQGSQSDDYLRDVATGLETLLSTREFVYYSYYARIREQIRQHWEPGVRETVRLIYRSGRSPASARDRITQVVVTLDHQGFLIKVEVISPSGVKELDDIAIEAFRSAAPFPNPPQGLVESDGTIKIRWDFVLEASALIPPPTPQEEMLA